MLLASVWLCMCHESDTVLSIACTASVESSQQVFYKKYVHYTFCFLYFAKYILPHVYVKYIYFYFNRAKRFRGFYMDYRPQS